MARLPKTVGAWALLAAAMGGPIAIAAFSPLLAWRDPVYIAAGFAGIVGLALLVVQPLLAGAHMPGLSPRRSRRLHALAGAHLVLSVLIHVGGLWITSPPDVVDVLLLRSPTPFSVWGVAAMWAVFAAALLAAFRRKLRFALWRRAHLVLATIVVTGTIVHAILIEGTMETVSKAILCALAAAAFLFVAVGRERRLLSLRRSP